MLVGGFTAEATGGQFWKGAAIAGIVAGANHVAHNIGRNIAQKTAYNRLKKSLMQQNKTKVIDNTEEALDHYLNGDGSSVQLGEKTIKALIADEDFVKRHQRIISGKTTSKKGFFGVDLTQEIFHVGDTKVNYSINCSDGSCTVNYEFFANDGFWDADVIGENVLGISPDGPGPRLELQGGTPYYYQKVRAHFTFENPGY